ncbi:hypothetical protein ACFQX7_37650 [Luedemannella flava]
MASLTVRGPGQPDFQPLDRLTTALLHAQDTPSTPGGDALGIDYRILVPSVRPDRYTVTLEYLAMTA